MFKRCERADNRLIILLATIIAVLFLLSTACSSTSPTLQEKPSVSQAESAYSEPSSATPISLGPSSNTSSESEAPSRAASTSSKSSLENSTPSVKLMDDKSYIEYIDKVWMLSNFERPDNVFMGFLYQNWHSIEKDKNKLNHVGTNYYISAAYYESSVMQYFDMTKQYLESGKYYSTSDKAYVVPEEDIGFGAPGTKYEILSKKIISKNLVDIVVKKSIIDDDTDSNDETVEYQIDQSVTPFKVMSCKTIR
jgi:hypothetical protein